MTPEGVPSVPSHLVAEEKVDCVDLFSGGGPHGGCGCGDDCVIHFGGEACLEVLAPAEPTDPSESKLCGAAAEVKPASTSTVGVRKSARKSKRVSYSECEEEEEESECEETATATMAKGKGKGKGKGKRTALEDLTNDAATDVSSKRQTANSRRPPRKSAKKAQKKIRKSKGSANKAKCARGCGRVAAACLSNGWCLPCQYPCGQPGCTKQRRGGQFCSTHTQDRRVCSTEGCSRSVDLGRTGDAADRCKGCINPCAHPGCTNQRGPSGFCDSHAPREECSTDGCRRRADPGSASGLCAACLDPCGIANCGKMCQAGGYCGVHAKEHAPEEYRQFRDATQATFNERYHNDADFRLACLVRSRMRYELKKVGHSHNGKLKLLGCPVGQFRTFIEQFWVDENAWMNWKNQGRSIVGKKTWQLDHVMPLASFAGKLSDPKEMRKASHWSNFQPLSWEDNLTKGSKPPAGFRWCDAADRWLWDKASGRMNYKLPVRADGDTSLEQVLEEFDDETLDFCMEE